MRHDYISDDEFGPEKYPITIQWVHKRTGEIVWSGIQHAPGVAVWPTLTRRQLWVIGAKVTYADGTTWEKMPDLRYNLARECKRLYAELRMSLPPR